jgi:glutathione synthase/RimK-type ligase-like ATP-grasp enzyme
VEASGYPQDIPSTITDAAQIDVIDNDCRAALAGLLLNEFRGTWINHPINSQLAQNKLVQLRAAKTIGFRVPRTLVSQDPIAIRNFCEELDYQVVVKSVSGTQKAPLLTMMLTPEHLVCDDSISLCPAIYQEYIPGKSHVRAQCFGDAVYSVTLKSEALDWRPDLNIPFEVVHLDEEVKGRLRNVMKLLGLKMGVVDLKFGQDGELVWFEINPQGQFSVCSRSHRRRLNLSFCRLSLSRGYRSLKTCVKGKAVWRVLR